jgi:hypothetical protein
MKTLTVKITDAADKSGLYRAIVEDWETLDSMIKVYKLGKDGQVLKKVDYFPFKSYHSNREIRQAYDNRYKNAKLEVVEELKAREQDGVIFEVNENISFPFNGHNYSLLILDQPIKTTIYIDDESEYYREYCHAGEAKKEQMRKGLFMGENEFKYLLKNLDESSSYWQYFNTTIDHIRKAEPTPALKLVLEHFDKLEQKHRARLEAYYGRYANKVYVHGYWANR